MRTWTVGDAVVTRIPEEGFELVLSQDGATAERLLSFPWLSPFFVTAEGALRVGSSATVVQSRGLQVLVDPWLAFDGDRSTAPAAARIDRLLGALAEAGFAPEDVDVVVDTHIDGVGANTRPAEPNTGSVETAAFPRARYLVPAEEISALRAGHRRGAEALLELADLGLIDSPHDGQHLTEEVWLESAPGHTTGHLVANVVSAGEHAVIVGHLFLHPAQIFFNERTDLDEDAARVTATRRTLLERCVRDRTLLVGPLFAEPGAGYVVPDTEPNRWRFEAVPPATA